MTPAGVGRGRDLVPVGPVAGSEMRFLTDGGTVALRYGGLAAQDATGRRLGATFSLSGDSLQLNVDDRGARCPVRIDPLVGADDTARHVPLDPYVARVLQ